MAKKKSTTPESIKLDSITPNPENPKIITEANKIKLFISIVDFVKMMELNKIIVDGPSGIIYGGNSRHKAINIICDHVQNPALEVPGGIDFEKTIFKDRPYLKAMLEKREIPANWVAFAPDLTEEEKRKLTIKDNLQFGEWDLGELVENWDLEELESWGFEFPTEEETPEDQQEFEEIEAKEDDYEAPEQIKIDVLDGDLIEFICSDGRVHRLICGDSRIVENIDKVLQGAKPSLLITDPPYGVEYNANWRNERLGESGRATGTVENDNIADWSETWSLLPCSVAYVYHASLTAKEHQISLEKCDFEVKCVIIWVKHHFAIGRAHYHWKHEPCFYAVKKGYTAEWIGDRKQTSVWEIAKPQKNETGHSTQKPVLCMATPIKNHKGDVFDPFLGSGTTMVAADQLGRVCYGCEISPKYCQIIIDRMKKYDPLIEVKINNKPYLKEE